jgi:hypothetical protein
MVVQTHSLGDIEDFGNLSLLLMLAGSGLMLYLMYSTLFKPSEATESSYRELQTEGIRRKIKYKKRRAEAKRRN